MTWGAKDERGAPGGADCASCVMWVAIPEDPEGLGECHRQAPKAIPQGERVRAGWALTGQRDWCGEYTAAAEPEPEPEPEPEDVIDNALPEPEAPLFRDDEPEPEDPKWRDLRADDEEPVSKSAAKRLAVKAATKKK